MGFKADTSFLRFLSMGAVGVHRTIERLRDRGFEPIELERYCSSNKIWTTKVKRLRLPDLLCVRTGMRAEVRAKTDLKIRMSDAPANPDRVWDAELRDSDIVALITCFDTDGGPEPADDAVYFTVGALRASVDRSRLGPPKSATEGAERDRTWPATVPTRDGTVVEVTDQRLSVQMSADCRACGPQTDIHATRQVGLRLSRRLFHCGYHHSGWGTPGTCRFFRLSVPPLRSARGSTGSH